MRMAIIATDNLVYRDNEARQCDCAELRAKGISAVQWNGKNGEIEYVGHKKPNENITKFSAFQKFIDRSMPLPEPPAIGPPATREEYERIVRAIRR